MLAARFRSMLQKPRYLAGPLHRTDARTSGSAVVIGSESVWQQKAGYHEIIFAGARETFDEASASSDKAGAIRCDRQDRQSAVRRSQLRLRAPVPGLPTRLSRRRAHPRKSRAFEI